MRLYAYCINGPGVKFGRSKGKQTQLPAFWLWSFGTCHCSVQNVLGKWPSLYVISVLNSQTQKATAQLESPFVLCNELSCLTHVRKEIKGKLFTNQNPLDDGAMLTRDVHLVEGALVVDKWHVHLGGQGVVSVEGHLRNLCYTAEVTGLFLHFTSVEMR